MTMNLFLLCQTNMAINGGDWSFIFIGGSQKIPSGEHSGRRRHACWPFIGYRKNLWGCGKAQNWTMGGGKFRYEGCQDRKCDIRSGAYRPEDGIEEGSSASGCYCWVQHTSWNIFRGNDTVKVHDALSVYVDQNGGSMAPDEFERQLV